MPIKEFIVKANEALPPAVDTLLAELFDSKLVSKAKAKGAKLKLVLTCPWPKPPKKEKLVVDEAFVAKLKVIAPDEAQLDAEISKLNGPQILKIGNVLGIPMSKTSKVPSLRAQLTKSLRSEIVWKGIAGHNAPVKQAS